MSKFKPLRILSLAVLCLALCVLSGSFMKRYFSSSFQKLTDTIFQQEAASNTLTLHYTLQNPEAYGITPTTVSYGSVETAASGEGQTPQYYLECLKKIPYALLSSQERQTYDILLLALENSLESKEYPYYEEPLGQTIGIQAQLPVLLSEYEFQSAEDVDTYLELLGCTDSYFAALLAYERKKSAAGLFMTDENADAVISQCRSFLSGLPCENLLVTLFNEKTEAMEHLSESEKVLYQQENLRQVKEHVFPAYRLLIQGLSALKGTGKNDCGLCYFPKGKAYYEYLIRSQTGSYLSVASIQNRIQTQIQKDLISCRDLLNRIPQAADAVPLQGSFSSPEEILSDLQEKMSEDFPTPPETSWQVKYVHPSLAPYLSPAFYLTAPIDNPYRNTIYINPHSPCSDLELYTTLAHEGYPGHLYQNLYSSGYLSPLRSLLNFGGYSEGWATYVEMISYEYAARDLSEEEASACRLLQKNRSIMLGLSSLLDIYIHYHGFTLEDTRTFLAQLGFSNTKAADSLYQAILESPGNYLKYYLGCLSFQDLASFCQKNWPEQFQLQDFHRKILKIGPCPFPVLEKYIKVWYTKNS